MSLNCTKYKFARVFIGVCLCLYMFLGMCLRMFVGICVCLCCMCLCFKNGSPNGYFTGLLYYVKVELDCNLSFP